MPVQINNEDFAKPWRPGIYPRSTTVIYNNQLWILNDTITGLYTSSDFLTEAANGDWIGRYTTEGDLSTKEDVANKATDFSVINDTLYPSVEAVKEQLDSKLDKVSTVDVEKVYIKNADGTQGVKATSEFGGREIYIKNISISGGYTVDFNVDTHRLTLIGNTTFSEINLPALGFSKTITLHINGNFGVVFPASWTQYISGAYKGTAPLNTIVVEAFGSFRKVQISQPD